MGVEIERKFLVDFHRLPFGDMLENFSDIEQGYLSTDEPQVRIRKEADAFYGEFRYYLTIKGSGVFSRLEYEYPISLKDADGLFELCDSRGISKKRYKMKDGWVVDIFNGDLDGLCMAEIELPNEKADLPSVPEWLGREVTNDENYYNVNLVENGLPKDFKQ